MKVYQFSYNGELFLLEPSDNPNGFNIECSTELLWFVKFNFELFLEESICLGYL